jgi:hypothetical protein
MNKPTEQTVDSSLSPFDRPTARQKERLKQLPDDFEIKGVVLKQSKKPMDTTDRRIVDEVIKYMDDNRDVHPYKWVMFASTASEAASDYGRTVRTLLEILTLAIPLKPDTVLQSFKAREFDAKYLHTATSLLEQAEAKLGGSEETKEPQMRSAPIDLPGPTFLPVEDEAEERTYQLTADQIDDLVSGKLALINGELTEVDGDSFGQGLGAMVLDPTLAYADQLDTDPARLKAAAEKLTKFIADIDITKVYENTEDVEKYVFAATAEGTVDLAYEDFLAEVKTLGADVKLLDVALGMQEDYWSTLRGRTIDAIRLKLILNNQTDLYLALEKEFWVTPYAILDRK